ncbi:MAG: helix-turn-helix transcriptional regulator [Prevotella sp.]|nr:helix-turn-helix transcriptional regulator [Prevotella sp.]
MNTQEKLGKAIQRLRAYDNISQEKLALSAGIDRQYMSDIENGHEGKDGV